MDRQLTDDLVDHLPLGLGTLEAALVVGEQLLDRPVILGEEADGVLVVGHGRLLGCGGVAGLRYPPIGGGNRRQVASTGTAAPRHLLRLGHGWETRAGGGAVGADGPTRGSDWTEICRR